MSDLSDQRNFFDHFFTKNNIHLGFFFYPANLEGDFSLAILGIDLGTSNSAASIQVGGEVIMIEPVEGVTEEGMVFPSYLAFDVTGEVTDVGITAKRQFQTTADLVVRHIKRLIGRSYDYLRRQINDAQHSGQERRFLDEFKERIERGQTGDILVRVGTMVAQTYTPQQIAAIMLRKIKEDAEPQVWQLTGGGIDGAVITVPAGFDDAPLRATLWAGEQVFGAGNVQLIPEPLAAAVASGVEKDQETIMVVDMGAGTTDIVVGNVIRSDWVFHWAPITQGCDDELGGWDMDCLILEHLLRTDQKEPHLRDIYPHLDLRARGRLMEAIERAKIACSTSDNGQVSVVLEADIGGNIVRKPFVFTLDEKTLRTIVAYKGKRAVTDKGSVVERCRQLVEDTLMELADKDPGRLDEVKQSLDRVILVGGPMRMRCLYDMMCEIFANHLDALSPYDPLDTFPMECVARGAALYQGDRVTLQVPHTLSIYEWGKGGYYSLIPRGTPYEGEATSSLVIDVEAGSTWVDIITEKESVALGDYPVREHLVRVPQKGKLEVTLHWDTAGCRIAFSGAGIAQTIIPPVSDQTTLAEDFERQFYNLLNTARNLRELMKNKEVRQRIAEMVIRQLKKSASGDIQMLIEVDPEAAMDEWKVNGKSMRDHVEKEIDRLLSVPDEELRKCDALDLRHIEKLQEDELRQMLQRGYDEGSKARAQARGISPRVFDVCRIIRNITRGRVTVEELIKVSKQSLRAAKHARIPSTANDELVRYLQELERNQKDRTLVANVAIRIAALADVLLDRGAISREAQLHIKNVAAQAEA